MKKITFILLPLIGLAACRATAPAGSGQAEARVIAVLPFDNESADIGAADKMRLAVHAELEKRGYKLVPLEAADSALKLLGISEGGQLNALAPGRLGAATGGELLCYGNVVNFSFSSVVAVSSRRAGLQLKIVRADTGAVIFEGAGEAVNSSAGADAAGQLALNVAGKIFKSVKNSAKEIVSPGAGGSGDITDKIADVDLAQETGEAVKKVINDFERRRGN